MIKNNDWNWSEDTLKAIIKNIVERKNEYVEEKDGSDYSLGVIDGYAFILDSIKNELEARGFDFEEWIK
ncbi:hypothetical protein O6R05_06085 [Peptoniphilus equinus]|uniref:Uncharacterized protein n=1 Tax=Peptoniphilus equinus TaxID=3016343 RepID=A0ABY7QRZ9_9FIRM|nr:hypothetical protein [Peptoniphilus equinus]WBW49563.1 hypothetical protein O6R05_06085 [Peptoniphilus equinus]